MNAKLTNTRKQIPGRRVGGEWTVSDSQGRHLGKVKAVYNGRWTHNNGKCVWDAPRVMQYEVEAVQEGFDSVACATFKVVFYQNAKEAKAAAIAWVTNC